MGCMYIPPHVRKGRGGGGEGGRGGGREGRGERGGMGEKGAVRGRGEVRNGKRKRVIVQSFNVDIHALKLRYTHTHTLFAHSSARAVV